MAQSLMSHKDVKRVIATAKMATHCRFSYDPVWRKITRIDDQVHNDIYLADPLGDHQEELIIYVKMHADPSTILFCRMEEVALVGPALTPAQLLFQKLLDYKQEMLKNTKSISSIKNLDKEEYIKCLLGIYETLATVVKPDGIPDKKKTYDWFVEQGCSLTSAAVTIVLCDELYSHWRAMVTKTALFQVKQDGYDGWPRRFELLDLVLSNLRGTRPSGDVFQAFDFTTIHEYVDAAVKFCHFYKPTNIQDQAAAMIEMLVKPVKGNGVITADTIERLFLEAKMPIGFTNSYVGFLRNLVQLRTKASHNELHDNQDALRVTRNLLLVLQSNLEQHAAQL